MIKVYRPVAAEFPISSPFGPRIDPVTKVVGSFHYGIDFAVPMGTPIVAAVTGKIVHAGWENTENLEQGFGFYVRQSVSIDEKQYNIYYGHMSDITVVVGQELIAGTRIGLSGNTGKTTGPHLHLECRPVNGKGVPFEFKETQI